MRGAECWELMKTKMRGVSSLREYVRDVVEIAACVVNYVPVVLFSRAQRRGGNGNVYSVAKLHKVKD